MPELETITASELEGATFSSVIDVRSPAEFAHDHLPGAINLPVLDDAERCEIGTIYKQVSPFRARRLGASIIARRVAAMLAEGGALAGEPHDFQPLVYCWRGGMRSHGLGTILASVGWRTRLLEGGYKAFRKHVLASLERLLSPGAQKIVVLGGLTGSGKTRVLAKLRELGHQAIDLEGLAQHRGSALGESVEQPQPSQKRFENLIWQELRALDPAAPVFVESESSRIGRLQIPAPLWARMGDAPTIELAVPLAQRARYLLGHYDHFVNDPALLREKLARLNHLHGAAQIAAWHDQIAAGDWRSFTESILAVHYDPAYTRSRKKLFRPPCATVECDDPSEDGVTRAAQEVAAAAEAIDSREWE